MKRQGKAKVELYKRPIGRATTLETCRPENRLNIHKFRSNSLHLLEKSEPIAAHRITKFIIKGMLISFLLVKKLSK